MSAGALSVATYGERAIVIASIIERYVKERPHAADTAEGIRAWWIGDQHSGDSLEDVQAALDHLVENNRLSRIELADGTIIYAGVEREGGR
jgi:hypothetical protein